MMKLRSGITKGVEKRKALKQTPSPQSLDPEPKRDTTKMMILLVKNLVTHSLELLARKGCSPPIFKMYNFRYIGYDQENCFDVVKVLFTRNPSVPSDKQIVDY